MNGLVIKSINVIFIALIPEKIMRKKLSDLRPTSLVTSHNKIQAKVLPRKLQEVQGNNTLFLGSDYVQS